MCVCSVVPLCASALLYALQADIARWRRDDLPLDIWGLDMDWRIWAHGEEGKGYFVNTKLFPDMRGVHSGP